MKVLAFSGAVFLLLAGCTAPPPQFEQMTEAELFAYNSTLPLMDQVYCRKQAETGTYIRKRHCTTIREMYQLGWTTLNTPSSNRSLVYGW